MSIGCICRTLSGVTWCWNALQRPVSDDGAFQRLWDEMAGRELYDARVFSGLEPQPELPDLDNLGAAVPLDPIDEVAVLSGPHAELVLVLKDGRFGDSG